MTPTNGRPDVGDDDLPAALLEARNQLHETGEILRVLGRSASDLDQVMRTVTASARRISRGDAALVYLLDGSRLTIGWASGLSDEYRRHVREHPLEVDRLTLSGRVALDRRTQQVADVLADPDYGRRDLQRVGGFRSVIAAPMLVDDEVVGVLNVWRSSVSPYDDREVELLTAYAAQAAVAIRTARLMRDLEAHKEALTRRLGQLEALSAIGESVSSSLDLDEVLTTIVTHAVALAGADGGSILELDPEGQQLGVRNTWGAAPGPELLEGARVGLDDTVVGRAATERRTLQVPDLTEATSDPYLDLLRSARWRSVVVVPMLRRERVVGSLVIWRRTPGSVDDDTCELLETFASQSSLALTNAQLYRRLERQSEELAVASRHKSEFLASMSHELRTPLNAVIGFSEVLLERMFGEVNERQAEYLGHIHASGKHLLELLNDILDLSKVEAGHMLIEPAAVDVRALVDATVSLVHERALRRGLTLVTEVGADVPLVHADELRTRQVVLNLLTNAVKFTPEGGTVTVRAEPAGTTVEVSVADDGPGISAADQERIFDSFQQGERVMGAQEGTGLGLTLSRRIVELHGGRLWVESELGRGSTFRFTLPVHEDARRAWGPAPEGGGPTVLLVEDDQRSSELVSVVLADQGFRVLTAPTGEDALEVLDRDVPSAVVLDIRLPGIDGWEVLARVKGEPALAHVPVIVVSILDEQGHGYALGADDYLVKPVPREQLVESLRRLGVVTERGRLVWVVDADPASRSALVEELEGGGWAVLASGSVVEGLGPARRRVPTAVLVDLPSVADDGFAGIRLLHADDVVGRTPVVALVPDDGGGEGWHRVAEQVAVAATVEQAAVGELLTVLDRVAAPSVGGAS
jgi:signal transduction histidine kinase/DNA-binding response OmpR family regulator